MQTSPASALHLCWSLWMCECVPANYELRLVAGGQSEAVQVIGGPEPGVQEHPHEGRTSPAATAGGGAP